MDLKNQNRTSQSRRSYRTSGSRWVRYPETGLVLMAEPRIANHEIGFAPKCGGSKGLLLHQRRQGELLPASFSIQADQTERRGLFEFSVGVCTRDCLSSIKALLETQASHAHASSEALHVPSGSFSSYNDLILMTAPSIFGIHTLCWNLSSRYQTSKSSTQPRHRYPHVV